MLVTITPAAPPCQGAKLDSLGWQRRARAQPSLGWGCSDSLPWLGPTTPAAINSYLVEGTVVGTPGASGISGSPTGTTLSDGRVRFTFKPGNPQQLRYQNGVSYSFRVTAVGPTGVPGAPSPAAAAFAT